MDKIYEQECKSRHPHGPNIRMLRLRLDHRFTSIVVIYQALLSVALWGLDEMKR